MFEAAELGRTISKDQYKALEPELRAELLEVQRALSDASFPVIIVFVIFQNYFIEGLTEGALKE